MTRSIWLIGIGLVISNTTDLCPSLAFSGETIWLINFAMIFLILVIMSPVELVLLLSKMIGFCFGVVYLRCLLHGLLK